MKVLLLLFIWLCSIVGTNAQSLIPRFETLGVNDGLPHSSVYSLLQDKRGFMWFGTADGLCRYDGNALVTYKYIPPAGEDASNNFVKGKMLEDKKGNIWYCNETGIYKWEFLQERVLLIYQFDKAETKSADFQALYLDAADCVWMLNTLWGVCRYDMKTKQLTRYPFPYKIDYSNVVLSYHTVDLEGNIYIRLGTKNDPFMKFNIKKHQYSQAFKNDPPQAIFFTKDGTVLAYDERLIYPATSSQTEKIIPKIVDGKQISFYSFDGCKDNYGRLWMTARGNGLFYYDEKHNRFRGFQHNNSKLKSLPFDLTNCLLIDRNENLWVGIDGGGVARIDLKQPRFNLFPLSEGDYPVLKDYFTKCFYEDEKGRIWFGSQNNGLNILDPVTQELKNYHHAVGSLNSLPGNMVGSIIKDSKGNIWVGSSGGISIFNESKGTFNSIVIKYLPNLYPSLNNFVYKYIELRNGSFLAATILGIVKVSFTDKGTFTGKYYKNTPYLCSVTTDVMEMDNGDIYATVPGFGVYQLRASADSFVFVRSYFPGIDLRSIRKDEHLANHLWIGSGTGLIHLNIADGTYKIYNEKRGIANSYVYGSLEDEKGNLWISTNKGLSFMDRTRDHFENYTYQDGLQSNEFNTQAFYKSNTGVFYFGGIKGFNWFTPTYNAKYLVKPIAAVTQVQINEVVFRKDSAFASNQTITVPYYQNDFNFKFAALDYTRPEANNIQYILENWDASWITADNNSARYANLPPGNYTLRVKASNAAGTWSGEEIIKVCILSPFWKQPWFIFLACFIMLLIIVFSTYFVSQQKAQAKLRLLEKQIAVDAERNRISLDMHDEIGVGITHIALLSELLQAHYKDDSELMKAMQTIGRSARKLVQTMSEIIWALNPENDTLDNLLTYTREQAQQYFESLSVAFTVSFPDNVPNIKVSNVQRRNLYLVTREALNNSMKHSGGNSIQLSLVITKKEFCFLVTDNGIGIITTATKAGHNGIRNMKKRMEDIGGTIEWIREANGTTVRYCVNI